MRFNAKAQEAIKFIEEECFVPEGVLMGQKMQLLPFQKKFLNHFFMPGVRKGILSIGRKNGKTGFIAALLLFFIAGKGAVKNSQIISGAMSRKQASLVFDACCKMIMLNPVLNDKVHITQSKKQIVGLVGNVTYEAISKQAGTAHGLSPVLAILDEVGQIKGTNDSFIDAITTSQGAYENSRLIAISTQAATDNDLFSVWIDDARKSEDKSIVCHVYEADSDCELLDKSQWRKANPALGKFRSYDDLKRQLVEASRSPSLESSVRNLLLNQRVQHNNQWLDISAWKECIGDLDYNLLSEQRVYLGLDLSQVNDLTAAVFALNHNDHVFLYPLVFIPEDIAQLKERRDKVPYLSWIRSGHLIGVKSKTIDYDEVCQHIQVFIDKHSIECLSSLEFDRYNIKYFRKEAMCYPWGGFVAWHSVGQGYRDMSVRCDSFLKAVLNKRIVHGANPLLNMAVQNAISVKDAAGGTKLDKARAVQKIDPLIAAIMAAFPAFNEESNMGIDHIMAP